MENFFLFWTKYLPKKGVVVALPTVVLVRVPAAALFAFCARAAAVYARRNTDGGRPATHENDRRLGKRNRVTVYPINTQI